MSIVLYFTGAFMLFMLYLDNRYNIMSMTLDHYPKLINNIMKIREQLCSFLAPKFTNIMMNLLWNGSYMYTFVKYRFGKLYSTYPLVRSFAKSLRELVGKDMDKPSKSGQLTYPWGSITRLVTEGGCNLRVIEDMFDFKEVEWRDKSINENLIKLKTMAKDLIEKDTELVECLVIIAPSEDIKICRVITKYTEDSYISEGGDLLERYCGKFLSVDYMNIPDQETDADTDTDDDSGIELQIDKSYLVVGNQLFSAAFIGRLLNAMELNNLFDIKYKLTIMDQDINMKTCVYGELVELMCEKNYEIMNLYSNKSLDSSIPPDEFHKKNENKNEIEDEETKSWDKIDMLE